MRQHYTQAQIYHARSSKEKRCWGVYFVFIGQSLFITMSRKKFKDRRHSTFSHGTAWKIASLFGHLVIIGLKGSHDSRISPKGMKWCARTMGDENALSTIKFSFNMKSFAKIEPHSSFINMVTTTGTTYVQIWLRRRCGFSYRKRHSRRIFEGFTQSLSMVNLHCAGGARLRWSCR